MKINLRFVPKTNWFVILGHQKRRLMWLVWKIWEKMTLTNQCLWEDGSELYWKNIINQRYAFMYRFSITWRIYSARMPFVHRIQAKYMESNTVQMNCPDHLSHKYNLSCASSDDECRKGWLSLHQLGFVIGSSITDFQPRNHSRKQAVWMIIHHEHGIS
jgi:hypothetical protein